MAKQFPELSLQDLMGFIDDDEASVTDLLDPAALLAPATSLVAGAPARRQRANSNDLVMGPDGYMVSRASTYATPEDVRNYRRTGSLATGDNGVGFFGGVDTTGPTPYASLPPDVLRPDGKVQTTDRYYVEVIAPNGKKTVMMVGDKSPAMSRRHNSAVLELNPAAQRALGSGDAEGYRWRVIPNQP